MRRGRSKDYIYAKINFIALIQRAHCCTKNQ